MCSLCLTTWTADLFHMSYVYESTGGPGGSEITCGCLTRKFPSSEPHLDPCLFVFVCVDADLRTAKHDTQPSCLGDLGWR